MLKSQSQAGVVSLAMIQVDLTNEQSEVAIDASRLRGAIEMVCRDAGQSAAVISLAVVDNPTIHAINRQYLGHDYPTDVLSFVLEEGPPLEGEIVVSAQQAAATADDYRWEAADELLLYAIHGALHLVGYDDHTPDDVRVMRAKEAYYLQANGVFAVRGANTAIEGDIAR